MAYKITWKDKALDIVTTVIFYSFAAWFLFGAISSLFFSVKHNDLMGTLVYSAILGFLWMCWDAGRRKG